MGTCAGDYGAGKQKQEEEDYKCSLVLHHVASTLGACLREGSKQTMRR